MDRRSQFHGSKKSGRKVDRQKNTGRPTGRYAD